MADEYPTYVPSPERKPVTRSDVVAWLIMATVAIVAWRVYAYYKQPNNPREHAKVACAAYLRPAFDGQEDGIYGDPSYLAGKGAPQEIQDRANQMWEAYRAWRSMLGMKQGARNVDEFAWANARLDGRLSELTEASSAFHAACLHYLR